MSEHLIQVKELKKYYNKGAIKALDGITVDIDKGDVMVVIGPSGSGWTSTSTARRWAWCSSTSTSSPT